MKGFNNYRIILLLGVLWIASCTDDQYDVNSGVQPTGNTIEVPFTFSVDKMLNVGETEIPLDGNDPLARTIPTDLAGNDGTSAVVKTLWVIQFTQNNDFLIASEVADDKTVKLIERSNETCPIITIANPPSQFVTVLEEMESGTFEDIAKKVAVLAQESDLWYSDSEGDYIFMSALTTVDFTSPTTEIAVTFTRNVAKVTLNLTLATGISLKSVQLCHIPKKVNVADQALAAAGLIDGTTGTSVTNATFPKITTTSDLMNYEAIVDFTNYVNSGTYTFSWYTPRNQQGLITNEIGPAKKTIEQKPYATYFKIVVEDQTGYQATFSIAPGANNTTDYNLIPNKRYTTTLAIQGLGEEDDRISNVTTFEGGSNSYILNPPSSGTRTYAIPIKQVYKYWKGTTTGYGNDASVLAGTWTVSHLWSDVTANGVTLSSASDGFDATGITNETGKFEVKIASTATPGNYIVALKNEAGAILWSWHLWVTDYNPDGAMNPSEITATTYKYKVTGGYVDRYVSGTSSTAKPWESGGTWVNAVMMDRNLGALSDAQVFASNGGTPGQLYYQFGRKDPFYPPLESGNINSSEFKAIKDVIKTPQVFYSTVVGEIYYWTSDHTDLQSTSYRWYDPAAPELIKSIYDPCPEGWKLPTTNGFFSGFTLGTTIYTGSNLAATSGSGRTGNGVRYWPEGDASASSTNVIWYPALGYISHFDATGWGIPRLGVLTTAYSEGSYFTANTHTNTKGSRMFMNPGLATPTFGADDSVDPAAGCPVRCVKLDATSK